MMELTWSYKAVAFEPYIWQAGNANNWGSPADGLYDESGSGQYRGYMYLDGGFKFRSHQDSWDAPDWGTGGSEGTLAAQAGDLSAEAGFYRADVDLAAMTYTLKKIVYVSVIGDGGDWGTDKDLTYNKDQKCWEGTLTLVGGEIKFRGNHNWDGDVDLGGSFDNLVHGGSNIAVEAGTYNIKLYISYAGNHKAVVTKQ